MTAYYNEIDPFAAQWLRNLISAGHIAPGDVDERSITEVQSDDLKGYDQCHFFAGIGVWSHALRLAGWPDDRPVWTGSCPCQPFSAAGKGNEFADERHLWPTWFRLIRECRPDTIFGEQVSSKSAYAWFDHVATDLEKLSFAVAAVSSPACAYGAPHERQRLYFVADACINRGARPTGTALVQREVFEETEREKTTDRPRVDGETCFSELADSECNGLQTRRRQSGTDNEPGQEQRFTRLRPTNGFWSDAEWLPCTDGRARSVEPGTFPLVNGATARVGRLRAYGNAIVAPQAAEFIGAYLDS